MVDVPPFALIILILYGHLKRHSRTYIIALIVTKFGSGSFILLVPCLTLDYHKGSLKLNILSFNLVMKVIRYPKRHLSVKNVLSELYRYNMSIH